MNQKLRWGLLILFFESGLTVGCGPESEPDPQDFDQTIEAISPWCDPANPPDTYDFYPASGGYPLGDVQTYPWRGEQFETYTDGQNVECSASRSAQRHLEVTSGCLISRYVGSWRRGFTSSPDFRVLAVGLSDQQRVKWEDQNNEARFNVSSWQSSAGGEPSFQGVHLFARYRTENDLYVASLRRSGEVLIQRKRCGAYTALRRGVLRDAQGNPRGEMATGTWYRLRFSAIGDRLSLDVDGVPQLQVTDGTFSWGTSGIRTDYANVYVDDWAVR